MSDVMIPVNSTLVQVVEAALLAAGRPLSLAQLAALFEEHECPSREELRAALESAGANCAERGFELVEVASGFRFQVREALSPWISRLWQERPQRYSRALLETLALIAYRQPITRGEIEEIRGVAVSTTIVKTLQEREWIRVVGHRDVPGRPAMYATTRQFLDYFNLRSLEQLPALADIRDLETLNAELGFGELADLSPGASPEPGSDSADGEAALAEPDTAAQNGSSADGAVAALGLSGADPGPSDVDGDGAAASMDDTEVAGPDGQAQ